jgi:hypothetical protein
VLLQQYVEQVVCVHRGEFANARALRDGGESGVVFPAAL